MKSYIGPGVRYTDDHHTGELTEVQQIDDGRWHHRFGASWLKTTDLCLERARKEAFHEFPNEETDAANVGEAVHTVIETNVELRNDGGGLSRADSVDLFHTEFSALMAHPDFAWKKYTEASARKFGEACTLQWYDWVLETLPDAALTEVKFVLPFVEDDERVIELSGAIDYLSDIFRDWKTNGSRDYQPWEYKRWAVQPTTYTWAGVELGLWAQEEDMRVPFEYVVMNGKAVLPQRFTVTRGRPEWEFLRTKVTHIARLIEAELSVWPLNDNHALCSSKWCPAWASCKGASGVTF